MGKSMPYAAMPRYRYALQGILLFGVTRFVAVGTFDWSKSDLFWVALPGDAVKDFCWPKVSSTSSTRKRVDVEDSPDPLVGASSLYFPRQSPSRRCLPGLTIRTDDFTQYSARKLSSRSHTSAQILQASFVDHPEVTDCDRCRKLQRYLHFSVDTKWANRHESLP